MEEDVFGVGGGVGIVDDSFTVGFRLDEIVEHEDVNRQRVFVTPRSA